ncbi:MAG: ECF transporter S component, partial [Anaerolineae bacterium]|nr:ECF transporter S component [Anaerolineae bacterium]MDW8070977.1 ECF transporter S component [Anaerolineae bacterium]
MMGTRILSGVTYLASAAIGLIAFFYPFFLPTLPKDAAMGSSHATDAPLLLTVLIGICFGALLVEAQAQAGSAKLIALLGVLVSINALLRFIEVAVPGPGGFSPIFFLIVTTGYVLGGRFGFLMGALTLLVSALISGGVGPWLPYQMFTAGWMGLLAPACRPLVRLLRGAE